MTDIPGRRRTATAPIQEADGGVDAQDEAKQNQDDEPNDAMVVYCGSDRRARPS